MSRATGFLRTVALAAVLGVTEIGDAYNTANTIPNMVFTLLIGGILTSAVVPVLVDAERNGADGGSAAGALLGAAVVVGVISSAVVLIGAPLIVRVLTSGASGRAGYADYAAVTTTWLRWFAPQVGLYAVGVLAVSAMTAKRRLFLGAAAPIATNLMAIGVVIAAADRRGQAGGVSGLAAGNIHLLGAGTTAAVAIAVAIQLWGARRTVPGLRPRWDPRHRALNGIARRAGWMLLYVGANQVGLIVVIAIATRTPGGVSAYQWAFTVMQLPYALIAVSIMSAAYPFIAAAADTPSGVGEHVRGTSVQSLRFLIPAAVGLALLAAPIATVVVGPDGADLVAAALVGFALSLIPFTVFQLLTRVSYAHGDTRGPATVNVAVNSVNVLAALVLVAIAGSAPQALLALAAAHAASYIVGVAALGAMLVRKGRLAWRDLTAGHGFTVAAATVMGLIVWIGRTGASGAEGRVGAVVVCGALAAVGAAVFAAVHSAAQMTSDRLRA